MKVKRKVKWKNILLLIFIIMCIITIIISIVNITKWFLDSKDTNNQINNLKEDIKIKTKEDNKNTKIINSDNISINDPYWSYIKMNLIDVNFQDLKEKNSDTIGWIKVNGTNINYPFVQTKDNEFYLTHSFDKSYNKAGWVFLDYRNNNNNLDKNTIIYAHGRLNKTMFGSLKNVLSNKWLNNKDNFVVKLSTENQNTLWQVFSVYKIPTTSDYLQIDFSDNQEFLSFSNKLIERSTFNFNTSINENDKILTLSTCYNNSDKVVLHAKLIKIETK